MWVRERGGQVEHFKKGFLYEAVPGVLQHEVR